jgi:hypothetical protein
VTGVRQAPAEAAAELTLDEPRRQARGQRVGQQRAGGGLALQLGDQRMGDGGQKRVLEAVFAVQRRDAGLGKIDAEAVRREVT